MKRDLINIAYNRNRSCPSCNGKGKEIDQLNAGVYHFGNLDIPYPMKNNGSIPIIECIKCGLIYKYWTPTPEDMRLVYESTATSVWKSKKSSSSRSIEKELVIKFSEKKENIDVIDIGSSDGGLLSQIQGICGRCSGLDVVKNTKCKEYITGEYIQGFVEESFNWSRKPYDVVTAFDLLEHLYKPSEAFNNISKLIKPGGVLIAQTGNPSFAEMEFGTWWYLNLFEHHICWSEKALYSISLRYGLTPSIFYSQHKGRSVMPLCKKLVLWVANRIRTVGWIQKMLLVSFARDIRTLAVPFSKDHFTVVFHKAL